MTVDRRRRLEHVFDEAQQQPPDTRAAFVADSCAGDEELRAEVLSLLDAQIASNEFLATSALDNLARTFAGDGWSLRPGERVGTYRVERLLGAGGSGEVWRSRDERLGRDVAIKVLSRSLSSNPERLRRFEEEARRAGSLNHSNILVVYDVGEYHGVPFIVSECLEGETLRRRLAAGPLPLDEALAIASGVASGLAAAHRQRLVHRDLKPENVFLRSDGGVKILDFGLAKLQASDDDARIESGTSPRLIAGTAGYMAPEQARGEDVDARSDLFALGAVVYEMLSGRRAFHGSSTVETLHAVLTSEPPDLPNRASLPPALTAILTRLLKKSPAARFQSAADLAWALDHLTLQPAGGDVHRSRARWPAWVAMAASAAAVTIGGLWFLPRYLQTTREVPLTQFQWTLPAGLALNSAPVVSPDGRQVVFSATDGSGARLFVHNLASIDAVVVPGTDGATQPFWSPNSKSVGFFADRKLMKVALAGGAPVPLADAPDGRGGAWGASGIIVFAPSQIASALMKVSEDSGTAEPATLLDHQRGDNSHRYPVFLPDGRRFLYFARSTSDERRGVFLGSVDAPAARPGIPILQADSEALYVPPQTGRGPGDLVYVRDGGIEVRAFDAAQAALAGDAHRLDAEAGGPTPYHPSMLSASSDVMAFVASPIPVGSHLGFVARNGDGLKLQPESEVQNWPRVSPDGHWLARQRIDVVRGNPDIWVEDIVRGTRTRVTTDPAAEMLPVWSPDGARIAYLVSDAPPRTAGRLKLNIAARDGTGVAQTLSCPDAYCEPTDWTPDSQHLVVNVRGEKGAADVWAVATVPGSATHAILDAPYTERDARISPNGRWIAYVSEESGGPEVAVRDLSPGGSRTVLSGTGGDQPVWRRDGKELFFVDLQGRLRSLSVSQMNDGSPDFGLPVALDVPPIGFGHFGTQYDVTPDGNGVYFIRRTDAAAPREIKIVMGWRALLDRP